MDEKSCTKLVGLQLSHEGKFYGYNFIIKESSMTKTFPKNFILHKSRVTSLIGTEKNVIKLRITLILAVTKHLNLSSIYEVL